MGGQGGLLPPPPPPPPPQFFEQTINLISLVHDVGAVFFDFKKAFDSVPYIPLITKLQQLNLDPNIVSWVRNYLSDRSQCVVINGVCSEYLPVISGVPQGSVLGPLLFLIYINDLTDLDISMGSKIVLYADDILLYRPVSSGSDFVSLQRNINMIQTWATSNFMTFNESKCTSLEKGIHCPLVHP